MGPIARFKEAATLNAGRSYFGHQEESAIYGTIAIMNRTTIYLPDDLKSAVENEAKRSAISEAEVIRQAIRQLTSSAKRPRQGALFRGGQALAEHVDDYMPGFGE